MSQRKTEKLFLDDFPDRVSSSCNTENVKILTGTAPCISPSAPPGDPHRWLDKSKHIAPYINYKTAPGEMLFEYF